MDILDLAPLTKVQAHPFWNLLTGKQRDFLTEFVANGGDEPAAVRKVFSCPTQDAFRAQLSRLRHNVQVSYLLKRARGEENFLTWEETLFLLQEIIYSAENPKEKLDALKLYASIRGWARLTGDKPQLPEKKTGKALADEYKEFEDAIQPDPDNPSG